MLLSQVLVLFLVSYGREYVGNYERVAKICTSVFTPRISGNDVGTQRRVVVL